MRTTIKTLLKPLRFLVTKLLVDPEVLAPHFRKIVWRETNAFRWSAQYIVKNQTEGDYVEFGVWKGNSFIEMYSQISELSESFYQVGLKGAHGQNDFNKMRFHAFDSFEGLPETKSEANPIQYFPGNYSADETTFVRNLRSAGVDMSRITITKGWFDKTLTDERKVELGLSKIAIAYLDCDIYESAADALDFVMPLLQSGSVIIFDDWFRNKGNPGQGVQGATLDWLKRNPKISLQHFHNSDTRTATFIVQVDEINHLPQINCV